MLLDTNASNNFMDTNAAKSLGLKVSNCPVSTLTLANGIAIGISYCTEVLIFWGSLVHLKICIIA